MRRFLRFSLLALLLVCVGAPAAFILFVLAMAALGIAIGVGSAIVGLVLTVLKLALVIVLPVVLVWWVVSRLLAPQRTY